MSQINKSLKDACQSILKDMLSKCTESEQLMFKRMYAHGKLDLPINEVVDLMVEGKDSDTSSDLLGRINNAMNQCTRTIEKKMQA